MWIFGYGSLIWRPAFQFEEAIGARLFGYKRRFWQGSTDHRGVPGAPGRVVTLLESPHAQVVGRAFRVHPDVCAPILAQLDHREKGGYAQVEADLLLDDGRRAPALVYVATPDNANYLGPAPLREIAMQIRDAHGPSGPNREYLFELERALHEANASDPHVFSLADAVRKLS